MKKILISQVIVLSAGTLFAWYNFLKEYANWLGAGSCTTGCTTSANPFLSSCFFGALFFTTALVLGIIALEKIKK